MKSMRKVGLVLSRYEEYEEGGYCRRVPGDIE